MVYSSSCKTSIIQIVLQFHPIIIYCHQNYSVAKMAHTRESFLIPELNVVANDAQLKNLQKKVLFNHYEKEAQQKLNRSESERKTYRNYYNPQVRTDTEIATNYMKNSAMYNKSFGIDLAQSYEKEMQRKQAKRRYEKDMEKKVEERMIQVAQNQLYLDKIRAMQFHQSFKRQAFEQLEEKQKKKAEERKRLEEQKQAFQRRYSTNLTSLVKQQSFRKHYDNVNGAFEQNQRNYLSYVAPANREKQKQKQRLVENSVKRSQIKLREQLQQEFETAERHRNQLRDSLVMQIREKQEKKKQQINQMRSQGYTSNAYQTRHHPINNPVDFKITHDNRYIIKELQSGLAKSGSQSILS